MVGRALYRRIVVVCAIASTAACERPIADPAAPSPPPTRTGVSDEVKLEVRFADALHVRPSADGVRSEARRARLDALDDALRERASSIRPLVSLSGNRLEQLAELARGRGAVRDPRSWYVVTVRRAEAHALVARLNALAEIDTAYVAPAAAPLPVATAYFGSLQNYFGAAPSGVGVETLRGLPGGDGSGVSVVDVEYDWLFAHEDLTLGPETHVGGDFYPFFGSDHGTAVLGILAGRNNDFGVTGAAPAATVLTSSPVTGPFYDPADAILRATAATREGDVILLEQQIGGPNGEFVPLEWIPSVYEATRTATLAGRIVVAAAGNGAANLDDPAFAGRFDRAQFNSGAIIVGAGDSFRDRLPFSTYGSRLDVQGRGFGVVTTGYGDLTGTDPTNAYTSTFNGTSSATAITAGLVTALQGYAKRQTGVALSAQEMATLLKATGSPQSGFTPGYIGPLPDVVAAASQVASFAPRLVSIDIKPRQRQNVVPMRGVGNNHIAVAVLATPTFDPSTIDVTTAGLGTGVTGFASARRDGAGVVVERADVDKDRRPDLVLEFSRDALAAAGALGPSSHGATTLVFRADLLTGGRVRGTGAVRLVP